MDGREGIALENHRRQAHANSEILGSVGKKKSDPKVLSHR